MCLSVLIAQEMVLQLEADGEDVSLFAIFDTWVLENSQIRALGAIDYYVRRLRRLQQLSLQQKTAAVRRTIRRWFAHGLDGSEAIATATGDGWKDVFPGKDFQPPQFRAPVLLFKRPRQPYYRIRDAQMGWGTRSLTGVEVCTIDCGHVEMLREPFIRPVAQKIVTRLQELEAQQKKSHSSLLSGEDVDSASEAFFGSIAS